MSVVEQIGFDISVDNDTAKYFVVPEATSCEQVRLEYERMVKDQRDPKALAMATSIVRDLISQGKQPEVAPILKAERVKDSNWLEVDESDVFTKSFLELMGCKHSDELPSSVIAHIGNSVISFEPIQHFGDYTPAELERLNPVPPTALRVVITPVEI